MLELGASGGKHHGSPVPDEMENIPLSTPSNITQQGTDTSGKLAKCWYHYRKHIILASILLGITALIILVGSVAHHVSNIGAKWQEVSQNKTHSVEMEEMLLDHRNSTVLNITHGILEFSDEVMDSEKSISNRDTSVDNTIHVSEDLTKEVKRRKREIFNVNENSFRGERLSSTYSIDSDYSSDEDDDYDDVLVRVGYQNMDRPQYYPEFQIKKVQVPDGQHTYVKEQNDVNIPLIQKYVGRRTESEYEYQPYNVIINNEIPSVLLKDDSSKVNKFQHQNLAPKPIYIQEKEASKILTEKYAVSEVTTSPLINLDDTVMNNEEARFLHRNKSQSSTLFPGIQNSMSIVQSAVSDFKPTTSNFAPQTPLNNVKTMLDVIAGSDLSSEPGNELKEEFVSQESCDEKLSSIHKRVEDIQKEVKQLSDSLLVMRAKSLIQNNSSFIARNVDDKLKSDIIKKVEKYWNNSISQEGTSSNISERLSEFPKHVLNYIFNKAKAVEAVTSHPGSPNNVSNLEPKKGNFGTIIDAIEVTSSHADLTVNPDSGNLNISHNSVPENLAVVQSNPRIVAPQATVRPVFEGSAIAGESMKTSHQLALTPTGISWTPVCMYSSSSPSGSASTFPTQPGFVTKPQGVPYWPFPMMHQQQNFYSYVPMQMKQTQGMQTFPQFLGQKPIFCTYFPPPTFQFPVVPGTAPAEMSFRQENVQNGGKAVEVLPEQEISEIKRIESEEIDQRRSNKTINAKNSGVAPDENMVDQDLGHLERLGKDVQNSAN